MTQCAGGIEGASRRLARTHNLESEDDPRVAPTVLALRRTEQIAVMISSVRRTLHSPAASPTRGEGELRAGRRKVFCAGGGIVARVSTDWDWRRGHGWGVIVWDLTGGYSRVSQPAAIRASVASQLRTPVVASAASMLQAATAQAIRAQASGSSPRISAASRPA